MRLDFLFPKVAAYEIDQSSSYCMGTFIQILSEVSNFMSKIFENKAHIPLETGFALATKRK